MGSFEASKDEKSQLLAGMDKTMAQKLAFTSAHFQLGDGARILDVGCGTGYGSYQFALLNPHLQVVALDYDRDYIERARAQYPLPNLSFIQGDARNFDTGGEKFDAIFNSSILHEVFSFTGYSQQAVIDSLQTQMDAVHDGGVILIRDFVRPENPETMIYIDLPETGHTGTDIKDLSPAAMLRLYAQWACAEKPEDQRGFFLEEIEGAEKGWQRFYLQHDWANEFILRKDYRERFYIEAKEKYGYFTPREYRTIPEALGARVIYTSPYANPWIVENRLQDKVRLFSQNHDSLCLPPTNFICVMQKVPPHQGVVVHEHKVVSHDLEYLKAESFQSSNTGEIIDLVSRPGKVFDIFPYYIHADGKVDVYARSDYPRPLVNIVPRQMSPRIDGKTWSGYMVEPFAVANQTLGMEQASAQALSERAGIQADQIAEITVGPDYYPAIQNINERVGSAYVALKNPLPAQPLAPGFSGFQENGALRPFNLQDMMRGIQVGMFPEARLELCAYGLASKLGLSLPDWMGQSFKIEPLSKPARIIASSLSGETTKIFKQVSPICREIKGVRSVFSENTASISGAQVVAQRELEFVVQARKEGKNASSNVAAIMPVMHAPDGQIMVGLKEYEYPSLQLADESPYLLTLRLHRLSSELNSMDDLKSYIADTYEIPVKDVLPLGEGYFPSMGIMPDRTYPLVLNVRDQDDLRDFAFVPLKELLGKVEQLRDANLMLAVYRLTHALGQWPKPQTAPVPTLPSP